MRNRAIPQRHVCVSILQEKTKNMAPETDAKTVLEESQTKFDVKGKFVEYVFYMERQGYATETIRGNKGSLRALVTRGASLLEPETVSARGEKRWECYSRGFLCEFRRLVAMFGRYSLR